MSALPHETQRDPNTTCHTMSAIPGHAIQTLSGPSSPHLVSLTEPRLSLPDRPNQPRRPYPTKTKPASPDRPYHAKTRLARPHRAESAKPGLTQPHRTEPNRVSLASPEHTWHYLAMSNRLRYSFLLFLRNLLRFYFPGGSNVELSELIASLFGPVLTHSDRESGMIE